MARGAVDGEEAEVVFDGTTGGPMLEVDVTDESVLASLAHAMQHWARTRQITMDFTPGGTEPEDEE